MRVLAGDIGGTNSRLAVFTCVGDTVEMDAQTTYRSADYGELDDVVADFAARSGRNCATACLGLPGPVFSDEVVRLTNLPWVVDRVRLKAVLGTGNLLLVNDVQAAAAGLAQLGPDQFRHLRVGQPDPEGNRVVVSIGTGLGVAALSPAGRAFATEGGHSGFSPRTGFDFDLLRSLSREFGHVSWERLASGQGLPRIHAFVTGRDAPVLSPAEIVAGAPTDAACGRALNTFRRYIGAAAGNVAMTLMATGGLYFAGGIAPRVIDESGAAQIMDALCDKGRMRALLERIPVAVVTDPHLALIGAARLALRL